MEQAAARVVQKFSGWMGENKIKAQMELELVLSLAIIVTAQLNLNWSWSETLKWVGSHPPTHHHHKLLRHFQAT